MQLLRYIKTLFKTNTANKMLHNIHLQTLDSFTPTNVLTQINNIWTYKAAMGGGGTSPHYIGAMIMRKIQNPHLIHGHSFV